MSPYAAELADAKLEALRALRAALSEAQTPAEKRRCAVAILRIREPDDQAPIIAPSPAPPVPPARPPTSAPANLSSVPPHLAAQLRALLTADRKTVIDTIATAPQELLDAMTPANMRLIAGLPP